MAPDRKRQRLSSNGDFRADAVQEDPLSDDVTRGHGDEWSSAHPTTSLFVRSLPLTATTQSLTDFFSQAYPLKHAVVILDKESGKSRGFGFVTFADIQDAQQAKEGLHGSLFEGRKLQIDFAKPRHRTSHHGRESWPAPNLRDAQPTKAPVPAPGQGRRAEEFCRLIVRNLPGSFKEHRQLAHLFMRYGKIKDATLPKCKPGLSPGFGFVVIRGKKNAEKAIAGVNGKPVEGRSVAVDWAVDKSTWQQLQTKNTGTLLPESTEADDKVDLQPSNSQHRTGECSDRAGEADVSPTPDAIDVRTKDSASRELETSSELPRKAGLEGTSDNVSSTLFVRNLPYSAIDEDLLACFKSFGPVRYARVVIDAETKRARGTGFVSFSNPSDARECLRHAPHNHVSIQDSQAKKDANSANTSILHDPSTDPLGRFTIKDRVVQVSQAVEKDEAHRLMAQRKASAATRDNDRRHLYLLTEGIVATDSSLHDSLAPSELRMREQNLLQRQKMVKDNPSLFLSLTRLSIRNLPKHFTAKDLKALAREAVVGFAKNVKAGQRQPLTKEEQRRDNEQMRLAETARRLKATGIVKQAKIIYESQDGAKTGASGEGTRSRGYGFVEYSSHRWALMGLRWLNGHRVEQTSTEPETQSKTPKVSKRLVAEFAIENARVVARRTDKDHAAHERPKHSHNAPRPVVRSQSMSDFKGRGHAMRQPGGKTHDRAPNQALVEARVKLTDRPNAKSSQGLQHLIARKRASRKVVRKGSG